MSRDRILSSSVEHRIIQCRSVYGKKEECNQIDGSARIKEARGLQKMHFNSHLEMLYHHEMYELWSEWEVFEDEFTLLGYDSDHNIIYSYKVIME